MLGSMTLRAAAGTRRDNSALDVWLEEHFGNGWLAAYRVVQQGSTYAFAELRIFPAEAGKRPPGEWSADPVHVPDGGITASVLRTVLVGEHRDGLEHQVDLLGKKMGASFKGFLGEKGLKELAEEVRHLPRRQGRPDLFYAKIAAEYVAEVEAGNRRPIRALAERLGKSPDYVRQVLSESRRRAFLTPTPRGVPGGELTPRARDVLSKTFFPGNPEPHRPLS
jgi:hypothetical protein